MKRIATMGDLHGSISTLTEIYSALEWECLDEIRHTGDIVDRGEDSHAVIQFLKEHNINGVCGNHEESILSHYNRVNFCHGHTPRNPEKKRTLEQITTEDVEYLKSLPYIHIDDEAETVFVHGGVWPELPWGKQPTNVCRTQLIHSNFAGATRWFNVHHDGTTEEEHVRAGWARWYHKYDHEYHVVFGHTVFKDGPMVYRNEGCGYCIGVDTGANWSGTLTAVIMPDLKFIQTGERNEKEKMGSDRGRDFLLCKI